MIEDKIREHIVKTYLSEGDKLDSDESLFNNGILDSLGVVKLTMFIEEEFKVSAGPSEVTIDNFDSVKKIAEFIKRKMEAKG